MADDYHGCEAILAYFGQSVRVSSNTGQLHSMAFAVA